MNESKINQVMQEYVSTGEMSGGSLFIHKEGRLIYQNSWGKAKKDTIFRMASISKVFTVVGLMKLHEKGKFVLDDKISRFIPSFKNCMVVEDERFTGVENFLKYISTGEAPDISAVNLVPALRDFTIRDLLTHSSGLEMGLYGLIMSRKMMEDGAINDDLEERIERYSRSALDFQPGTATGYSPLAGFDVLARLIEILSDMSFDKYMKQEVFEPLEMEDAAYHLSEEQKERLIPLYRYENGNVTDVTGTIEDLETMGAIGKKYHSGSAGVYCRAEEFDHLAEMFEKEGMFRGKQILNSSTIQLIYKEHAVSHLEPEPGMEWALGVKVRQDPQKAGSRVTKGTYGWSGAFGTHLFISPKDELAVSFCMNRSNIDGAGSYISKKIEELVFTD